MTAAATYAATAAVRRALARTPHTGAALRRAVKYEHRDGLADALAHLTVTGEVIAEPVRGGGTNGVRYRLADPEPPAADRKLCTRCRTRRRRATGELCGHCLVEQTREEPR